MQEQNFMGLDGFVWFTGVVEDRNDPESLGRVRVRCVGYHTEDLNDIPTSSLPWATVMSPTTTPSMQGLGVTPSFLVEGSWVVGFFADAGEKQQPIIIGSLPGVPQDSPDYTVGFNDPRSPYSKQPLYAGTPTYGPYPVDGFTYTMPSGHDVGESDTSRLAQGELSEQHEKLLDRIPKCVEVEKISSDNPSLISKLLAERGCNKVLWECGPRLATAAIKSNCIQEIITFIAPKILGGENNMNPLGDFQFFEMNEIINLRDTKISFIGNDICVNSLLN